MVLELVAVVQVISKGEGGCGGEIFWLLGCMESLSREV